MAATNTTNPSTGTRGTRPAPPAPTGSRFPQLSGSSRFGDSGVVKFAREVRSELRKVVWPGRQEVQNLTIVVLAVSVAVGTVLGGIDFLFERLFRLLLAQ